MKKIISILLLSICYISAKAQTPKILISYDENGNRILRQYLPYRPAPPPVATDSTSVANENENKSRGISALVVNNENNVKVYPNPSNDNFNIVVSQGILDNNAELLLMDQLGRILYRKKVEATTTTISTKQMADGAYNIIVQYGNNKSTLKIVKETN